MTSFPFDNSYARLPETFYRRVPPTPVAQPRLIRLNEPLAVELGLDPGALATDAGVEVFAGNRVPDDADTIATAYAGHQFGTFVPQLGDGRAILLGEVIDRNGIRRDIQLKGAGRTPFSRGGDGRAAVGPVLREYIVSEAMFALGIPTTRSLAAVTTGESVYRETALPGAVLTRVASSHIRVGTFQFFAARRDTEAVRLLADHVIERHYPQVAGADRPYRALLDAVIAAQAELIAKWLHVGFIHGVMNTDNMSIAGETIDYGPCAFMDEYNPNTVFSSIDRGGRYAYGQQPAVGEWNLSQFAACLLPLLADDREAAVAEATEALDGYAPVIDRAYRSGFRQKIGLFSANTGDVAADDATDVAADDALVAELLVAMAANMADFTLTFRALCDAAASGDVATAGDEQVRHLFSDPAAYDAWAVRWRQRLQREPLSPEGRRTAMRAINPAYIPRNHRVEAVISAAIDRDDFGPFHELLAVLAKPFDDQPQFARYRDAPLAEERVFATFCGT